MEILVKLLTGKIIILNVKSSDTVGAVKQLISGQLGSVPADQLSLTFAGRQLADDHTLNDYGIEPESVLQLIHPLLPPATTTASTPVTTSEIIIIVDITCL